MAALNSKVRKAVIPVAGLGTRMLPATKAIPKEMLPLVDKPLIQYVVDECIAAGTVSYTHLDVYKRQACGNVLSLRSSRTLVEASHPSP